VWKNEKKRSNQDRVTQALQTVTGAVREFSPETPSVRVLAAHLFNPFIAI
jgi:hypothetical protein